MFAREEVENEEMKRRREIMSDCVFDRQERREEMNGFSSVRSKHNGVKREGGDGGARNTEHQWR